MQLAKNVLENKILMLSSAYAYAYLLKVFSNKTFYTTFEETQLIVPNFIKNRKSVHLAVLVLIFISSGRTRIISSQCRYLVIGKQITIRANELTYISFSLR